MSYSKTTLWLLLVVYMVASAILPVITAHRHTLAPDVSIIAALFIIGLAIDSYIIWLKQKQVIRPAKWLYIATLICIPVAFILFFVALMVVLPFLYLLFV